MDRLKGKVAIITGASAGIGKASALLFASEGASLGLIDINETEGEVVVGQIQAAGGQAKFIKADVASADALRAAIDDFAVTFAGIDILYNNAGNCPLSRAPRGSHVLYNWRTTSPSLKRKMALILPNGIFTGGESALQNGAVGNAIGIERKV